MCNFAQINIRGLRTNLGDLELFLHMYAIDVACISETNLLPTSDPTVHG